MNQKIKITKLAYLIFVFIIVNTIIISAANVIVKNGEITANDLVIDTSTVSVDPTNNRVGIGTTSAQTTLEVADTSWSSGAPYGNILQIAGKETFFNDNWGHLLITDSNSSTGNGGMISFGIGRTIGVDVAPFATIKSSYDGSNNGSLIFMTRGAGVNVTERMRINSAGEIGIGLTAATSNALEIGGNGQGGAIGGGYATVIRGLTAIDVNSGSTALTVEQANVGNIATFNDAGTPKVVILDGGNVGINTSAPSEFLEINGRLKVNLLAAATANTLCYNNTGVLSSCTSSIKYKEDVQNLTNGLNHLNQMRSVNYKWKGRDERDIGFIAEEMNEIDPIYVTLDKNGDVQGVKYNLLTAVLAKAIQEQQKQINQLKEIVCLDHPEQEICN
ncbi:tail fiber domain-containing protein [Candidatus Woesearchaeota archaeon]|jgi:hypothetical protein|nr:tail fiber domain-containing protein [Candidatus Woesearchaeota archaeon]MBT4387823.1 tail fiber domain-containing protein [Candidatus Woesearchaeota archaeon]MBT4595642.1 tail fiber domain-containing protein [Candidatus Woesearchaeota archaeon]MBT5740875.1 tail fiber domain-containing protein [Candidatus Woesearchaeota archaeon]MBT6505150.1 tail fiber domain-containing protein [Candidatus Woesearchaeota archaeon]